MGKPARSGQGDVEITAAAKAEELTFSEVPEVTVDFPGDTTQVAASGSDRINLPEQVEAGVTYRNIRVDFRATSRMTESHRREQED